MDSRAMRQRFLQGLLAGLRIVWPILSGVLVLIGALGIVVGMREGWSLQESIYFSFVTGLTIGYGDLAPRTLVGRVFAVFIGVCGVIVTGLIAAIAVRAITAVYDKSDE